MKAIVNGTVIAPDRLIPDGVVLIDDGGRIAGSGERGAVNVPKEAERIDAGGAFVAPGFVDIHCHAGNGMLAYKHPYEVAMFHLRHGTTSFLPTLSYNESREETLEGLNNILAVIRSDLPYKQAVAGIHMEGPYINPKYGAIVAPIRPVDPEEYTNILRLAGRYIKVWTLAPELEGQERFAEAAAAYGIALSVGHSEATAEEIFRLVPKGLRIGCHCTNASGSTPNVTRIPGTREVGVAEAILVHDDIFAEVIPDSGGIHVRPLMLKLILKAKGADKVIIITDNYDIAGAGGGKPPAELGFDGELDDVNFNFKGDLSGSKLTMDQAVRNMRRHTGADLVSLFRMAALNPAKATNMDGEVGSIEAGKRANLLFIDEQIGIRRVFLDGRQVESL